LQKTLELGIIGKDKDIGEFNESLRVRYI